MNKIDAWASRPVAILGVSGTRALLGFAGLMFYVSQYGDRHYLFGPGNNTLLPHHVFLDELKESGSFSIYAWSTSPVAFEVFYHLGVITALAVTLGIGGRPALAVHGIFLWSLYQRQSALMDGGDNLMHLVIPMLLLTRCYDHFALRSPLGKRMTQRVPETVRAAGVPLHNLGVTAIAVQMCLVYMVSGLYKVQGQSWQDGTALFYIMRVPEFELPGISELVYTNDVLVYVGTYATVIFLVYFPLGVLVPALRPWAAAASIGFHVSIGFFMGLTGFALTMIACDLVFLSPELGRALKAVRKLGARSKEPGARREEKAVVDGMTGASAQNREPVAAASAE
ncbi:HTTM domain-containing protein [Streptomyces europaeiscabiei]|nr:HTTM domain-containing protein [Streptomyces europaeiscabiei]MDX3694236.1 HTTM domain-containing protein [Streptomyces europaeiscabiei]